MYNSSKTRILTLYQKQTSLLPETHHSLRQNITRVNCNPPQAPSETKRNSERECEIRALTWSRAVELQAWRCQSRETQQQGGEQQNGSRHERQKASQSHGILRRVRGTMLATVDVCSTIGDEEFERSRDEVWIILCTSRYGTKYWVNIG